MITGAQPQPYDLLKRTGLYDRIGAEHFFDHTGDAINAALAMIHTDRCAGCRHAAFRECGALSGMEGAPGRGVFKGRKPAVAGKLSSGVQ
ncbi:hypothetical protein D3C85_1466530 [compost metagenome]